MKEWIQFVYEKLFYKITAAEAAEITVKEFCEREQCSELF